LEATALVRAAKEYAIPQICIVAPTLIICLGLATTNAVRRACGKPTVKSMEAAITEPFAIEGIQCWAQAHPGHFGQVNRNRNCSGQVDEDWQRMREWLRSQAHGRLARQGRA